MGAYYWFENRVKMQSFEPDCIGWVAKMGHQLNASPAFAVYLLVCASRRWKPDELAGSWHGDPVYFVHDLEMERREPDRFGLWWPIRDRPRPRKEDAEFIDMTEQSTDISTDVVAMLNEHVPEVATRWDTGPDQEERDLYRLLPDLDAIPRHSRYECDEPELVVNPAKREYLRPVWMDGPEPTGGPPRAAAALAVSTLVCTRPTHMYDDMTGSWHGDALFLAGADDPPDEWGITTATATDPTRNLYRLALDEYTDVSDTVLAMLVEFHTF